MSDVRAFATACLKTATALLLDLYLSFVGFGYLVGYLSDAISPDGIQLSQSGVAVTFALMAAYFAASARYGGTPWQRVMGTARTVNAR